VPRPPRSAQSRPGHFEMNFGRQSKDHTEKKSTSRCHGGSLSQHNLAKSTQSAPSVPVAWKPVKGKPKSTICFTRVSEYGQWCSVISPSLPGCIFRAMVGGCGTVQMWCWQLWVCHGQGQVRHQPLSSSIHSYPCPTYGITTSATNSSLNKCFH
jgi:hypothetical protein